MVPSFNSLCRPYTVVPENGHGFARRPLPRPPRSKSDFLLCLFKFLSTIHFLQSQQLSTTNFHVLLCS